MIDWLVLTSTSYPRVREPRLVKTDVFTIASGVFATALKMQICPKASVHGCGLIISIQSNLDYPDLDYPAYSIIRTFFSGPNLFMNIN